MLIILASRSLNQGEDKNVQFLGTALSYNHFVVLSRIYQLVAALGVSLKTMTMLLSLKIAAMLTCKEVACVEICR